MKKTIPILLILLTLSIPNLTAEEPIMFSEEFTGLYNEVINSNPELEGIRQKVAGSKMYRYSKVFPMDPMAEVMVGSMGLTLNVEQMLADPAVYAGAYIKENGTYLASRAELQMKEGMLLFSLKKNYLELYSLYEKITILEKNIDIINMVEDQILSRLSTGAMLENKIIMLQIEREELKDRLLTVKNNLAIKKANIEAIIGKSIEIESIESINETNIDNLVKNITDSSIAMTPDYLMMVSKSKMVKGMHIMEVSKVIPDITIGTTVGLNYSGSVTSGPMVMVMGTLPLYFPKQILGIGGTSKKYDSSQLMVDNAHNKLAAKLVMIKTNIENTGRSYTLYKDLLKGKARQNLEQVISQFAVSDNNDFSIVLEAFRKVLMIDMKILDLQVDHELAIASLEQFYGMPVNKLQKVFSSHDENKEEDSQ